MKKIFSIISLIMILTCCKKKVEYNSLNGNYYLFSKDSIYSELFITDKEMAFYNDITDVQFWEYYFSSDTLVIKTGIPDMNHKYLIDNSLKEIILLNNVVNDKKLYLNPITDSGYGLRKAFESDFNHLKYQIAYSNRRNKIFGVSKNFDYDSIVKAENSDSVPKTLKLSY